MDKDVPVSVWPEWELIEKIGEGSFGKVYKAKRTERGRSFYSAIKIISIPASKGELDSVRSEMNNEQSTREYFRNLVEDCIQEIYTMEHFCGNSYVVSFEDFKVVEYLDEIGWDISIRMEYLTSFMDYCTVVCRKTRPGVHEACGHERRRRRLRQLGDDGSQRRAGRRGSRRPLDALVPERAGFTLLRQVRPCPDVRALHAAGGLRHGAGRVRFLGKIPHSRTDAPYDPHGPLARHGRTARGTLREQPRLSRPDAPMGADAGQFARKIRGIARRLCPLRRGGGRKPLQPLRRC